MKELPQIKGDRSRELVVTRHGTTIVTIESTGAGEWALIGLTEAQGRSWQIGNVWQTDEGYRSESLGPYADFEELLVWLVSR